MLSSFIMTAPITSLKLSRKTDLSSINKGNANEQLTLKPLEQSTATLQDAAAIIKVNQRRWETEECFRIMKSEFKARPVRIIWFSYRLADRKYRSDEKIFKDT